MEEIQFNQNCRRLGEILDKHFKDYYSGNVHVACYEMQVFGITLEDVDKCCEKIIPFLPYLNEKTWYSLSDQNEILYYALQIFYEKDWDGHTIIDQSKYNIISHIQNQLGIRPRNNITIFDDTPKGQVVSAADDPYDREDYRKSRYDGDNFDALTDGQMGDFDDFTGNWDDVDNYMGR